MPMTLNRQDEWETNFKDRKRFSLTSVSPFKVQRDGRAPLKNKAREAQGITTKVLLTCGGVENVNVGVDVGVIGAADLDRGRGGKDQDVGAGGVLWGAQLGRLHVQGGAAAKHGACRHRV